MSLSREAARIIGWTAAIYFALWILASCFWPTTPRDQPLDSLSGATSLYRDPVREVVYSLPMRCNGISKRRVIILGSSAAKSFRPEILRAAINVDEVDNLALDYSNVTQIRQLFQDLQSCLGNQAMRSTAILFVTTYILYGDSGRCYPDGYTVYETEKIRHGLYSGKPNALTPTFGPVSMPWAITLLRPVFALYIAKYDLSWLQLKAEWEWRHFGEHRITLEQRRTDNFQHLVAWVPEQSDSENFGTEQFQELDRLVKNIKASGARVIFVEEPVEGWLRDRAHSYKSYRERMAAFDLSDSANDSEFSDLLHPAANRMSQWTHRLAEKLLMNTAWRFPSNEIGSQDYPAVLRSNLPGRVSPDSRFARNNNAGQTKPVFQRIFDSIPGHRK
jgi:hypothetical protein